MAKDSDFIEVEGIVVEALPNALFKVELESQQTPKPIILGYLAGKLRVHRIKILPGDTVKLELSPYDMTKGRIVRRK